MNWEEQIDEMTNVEMRRFIKNLCRHSNDEEVELPTRIERAFWNGILPALEINKSKYEKKVEASKENGKLGGAPKGNQNARKEETTQNNLNKVIRDNSKELSDKSKKVNDKSELENDNWQEINANSKITNEKKEEIIVEKRKSLADFRIDLNKVFNDYPNWENDLYKIGIDQFIAKTGNYHFDDPVLIAWFRSFYSY